MYATLYNGNSNGHITMIEKHLYIMNPNPAKRQKLSTEKEDCQYFTHKGLRFVKPYIYKYETGAKKRWMGKSILDAFVTEYKRFDEEYFRNAIISGNITVNGKPVKPEYVFSGGEQIAHVSHRHEGAVNSQLPTIIYDECDEYIAVNKPYGIPVHAAGQFRCNTVHSLLNSLGHGDLLEVHRLDMLTSGVLLFAKTKAFAHEFREKLTEQSIQKLYVAKVVGELVGVVECTSPLRTKDFQTGKGECSSDGKPSKTIFIGMKNNLVLCVPCTGRQHQIRLHLQHLGHPIVNDPYYSDTAQSMESVRELKHDELGESIKEALVELNGLERKEIVEKGGPINNVPIPEEWRESFVDWCLTCRELQKADSLILEEVDIKPMCLHAWKYIVKNKVIQSPLPEWAYN